MSGALDLGHGITCIDTGYTRPQMTACYLMEQGGHAAIIETGVNHNVAGLLDLLDSKNIARQDVDYIMPTHVHLDHAGGVGALMQALPNAQLVIHPYGARHMIDPSKLVAGASAVYGEDKFTSLYGELIPVDKDRVIEAAEGFTLDFHGRQLEFIDTPGHARHHYCIVDKASGGIFTGDTMGLGYAELNGDHPLVFPTTTPVQFDPEALHISVDRIMSYKPQWLYLTHFGRVGDTEVIARQLHEDINSFVSIARETGGDEKALEGRLMAHMLGRVADNGCTLDRETVGQLLQGDITLNAQGISIWIDKP